MKTAERQDTSMPRSDNAYLDTVDDPAFVKILQSLPMQDIKSLRQGSRLLKRRVELHCKKILILTARSKEDLEGMKDLQYVPVIKLLVRGFHLTITDLYRLVKLAENNMFAIDLSNTKFTGAGMTGLHAPQLEDLNLSYCKDLTDSGLLELLTNNCDKLKRLNLLETKITGTGLTGIHAPQLEDLILSSCYYLTDSGLLELLANSCAKLKRLDLTRTKITGTGLTGLHAPQLEDLNLPGCQDLTDSGLLELLANNFDKLKRLYLSHTKITGTGLTGLHVPHLEDLNLSHCPDLTDSGLLELLANNCARLKRLDLSGTSITSAGLDKVRSLLPQCDVCY